MNMRIGVNLAKEFKRLMKHSHVHGYIYSADLENNEEIGKSKNARSKEGCCITKPISFIHKIKVLDLNSREIMSMLGIAGAAAAVGYMCGKSKRRSKSRFMADVASVFLGSTLKSIFSKF